MTVGAILTGAGRNQVRFGKATAERVRRVAKKLGYRPNMAAQQLSGLPSRLIGVVGKNWFTEMPLRVLSWLNQAADDAGFRIINSQTNSQREPLNNYLGECSSRGVDGVIYLAHGDDPVWNEARGLFSTIPCAVALMGDPGIPGVHCVLSDFAGGVKSAVEHLHERGRRRIVQVLEDVDLEVNRQRREGMIQGFQACGLPFTDDSICVATKGWGYDSSPQFDELIEELVIRRKADAIIGDTDGGTIAIMNALRRRGMESGKDVAFVGWGHELYGLLSVPTLTTVQFHLDQLCKHAINLIRDHVEQVEFESPARQIVPADLVIRESSTG